MQLVAISPCRITKRCNGPARRNGPWQIRSVAGAGPAIERWSVMLLAAFHKLRLWRWKRRYRPGTVVSRIIAPDVRRDVEVLDTSRIDAGVITARTRTWNVLYAIRKIEPEPPFGDAKDVAIKDMWRWTGASWDGAVPDSDRAA
jgi:hypothetical protein